MALRITERRNDLTKKIDVVDQKGMIRLLNTCDAQMFCGYEIFETAYCEKHIETIVSISQEIKSVLEKKGTILIGGCGTSGRLAWLCSRAFNKLLPYEAFKYRIAGGDKALIATQEAFEDLPTLGAKEFEESGCSMYIGITCGLSAPYVSGQLQYGMNHDIPVALIGFNPTSQARKTKLTDGSTFYDVVERMKKEQQQEKKKCFILNPILGPEGIAGSSRMKGGSMTKILLDVLFILSREEEHKTMKELKQKARSLLHEYETSYRYVYAQNLDKLPSICLSCGESLKKNDHIYYISIGSTGMISIIDASECVPTFGASFTDIRGFIAHGWETFHNNDGAGRMVQCGEIYNLSLEHFIQNKLPKLTKNDSLVFVISDVEDTNDIQYMYQKIFGESTKMVTDPTELNKFLIWMTKENDAKKNESSKNKFRKHFKEESILFYSLPKLELLKNLPSLSDFSIKLLVNMISTTAHITKGVTYSNIMVNLKLGNSKLVDRGVKMIRMLMNVPDESVCQKALLRAIYEEDIEKSEGKNDIDHCRVAAKMSNIIPISLLLVSGRCENVKQAKELLQKEPIVRNVIETLQKEKHHNEEE